MTEGIRNNYERQRVLFGLIIILHTTQIHLKSTGMSYKLRGIQHTKRARKTTFTVVILAYFILQVMRMLNFRLNLYQTSIYILS
jgi:hypothetical protein